MVNKIALSATLLASTALGAETDSLPVLGETVSATVSATTAKLFDGETFQITEASLASLAAINATDASIFGFASNDSATLARQAQFGSCKTYAGDALWPSDELWDTFNKLSGGKLIKTVPMGSVCYDDFGNENADSCNYITANWNNNSYIFTDSPVGFNTPLYEGCTCIPPTLWIHGNGHCTDGGLPSYSVNVSTVADVQLAVNFARSLNLRLNIKNTGHDFAAKSMGGGALSIWTHNLKDIEFYSDFTQGSYSGPAMKVGAGVQAFEMYEAANKYGVTAVGGEGQTVGLMGGYIQGGGHSPISGWYGMAADSILAIELVTADGRFLTVTEESEPDLFWAISGAGGSTYGVVTSMVIQVQEKIDVSTMTLSIGPTSPDGVTNEQLFAAMRIFFSNFVEYGYDKRMYIYFTFIPVGTDSYLFSLAPWFAPNTQLDDFKTNTTEPLLKAWADLGIETSPVYGYHDNYYDAWKAVFPLETFGSLVYRQGSRLFPKENFENETKFNATWDAITSVMKEGAMVIGFNIAPRHADGKVYDNAINPAWSNNLCHLIMAGMWETDSSLATIQNISDTVTFDWMERWRAVTPGSGAYMSEADYIEPNFQQSFWGDKYARALAIKEKWDPNDVFYAHMAVGSDKWEMTEKIFGHLPLQASKLCRV
ncbi:hypothetical protein TD95_000755 [Thielaviopsis punctulata]|uniref:FAD-binding PCMH-type domain-containing protein n=1 Tax=Thielaviopsis punctulata TaxID=72032 RepID=A0A0F4ZL33_9PEZI|nr:hypothetical protein TD95_000755 [Thielaviopsis punctulata]